MYLYVSDGFLLNLNLILLYLVQPFAESFSLKLLKINPIYAISQNENVHLKSKNIAIGNKNIYLVFFFLYRSS